MESRHRLGGHHGGLQALAAEVGKEDEDIAGVAGNDLEQPAADLSGGPVEAADGEAGNGWGFFADHDALDLAGSLEL